MSAITLCDTPWDSLLFCLTMVIMQSDWLPNPLMGLNPHLWKIVPEKQYTLPFHVSNNSTKACQALSVHSAGVVGLTEIHSPQSYSQLRLRNKTHSKATVGLDCRGMPLSKEMQEGSVDMKGLSCALKLERGWHLDFGASLLEGRELEAFTKRRGGSSWGLRPLRSLRLRIFWTTKWLFQKSCPVAWKWSWLMGKKIPSTWPKVGEGEASVRRHIEERGRCREACSQSRHGGAQEHLGEVEGRHPQDGPVASPHSSLVDTVLPGRSDQRLRLLTHYTPPCNKALGRSKDNTNSRTFWESYITTHQLIALKSYFTFQASCEAHQPPAKEGGDRRQGITSLLKLWDPEAMRVHWILIFFFKSEFCMRA